MGGCDIRDAISKEGEEEVILDYLVLLSRHGGQKKQICIDLVMVQAFSS
jgi:hypothetical protein